MAVRRKNSLELFPRTKCDSPQDNSCSREAAIAKGTRNDDSPPVSPSPSIFAREGRWPADFVVPTRRKRYLFTGEFRLSVRKIGFREVLKQDCFFFWNGDILTASMADLTAHPFAIWRPYFRIFSNILNFVFFLNKKKVLS